MAYKILVIGDVCEDEYIYCSSNRFCPDAPVPILNPIKKVSGLGMAGNVVENLQSLGNCEVDAIFNKEYITKTRYVDDRTNHMFIRIDEGESNIRRIGMDILKNINWDNYDAVVVSDYDKGFLKDIDIRYISTKHSLTFLDTKKPLNGFAQGYTFIKINNFEHKNMDENYSDELYKKLIVTKGAKGATHRGITYPVPQVDIKDTSGAGDTFLAALVFSYIEERHICNAIDFANICATKVVQKKGTVKIN